MHTRPEDGTLRAPIDDFSEDPLDLEMDDNDYYLDDDNDQEFDEPAETELDFEPEEKLSYYTARQRIEMAREARWLEAEMADFDEIDGLEYATDTFVEAYSH